MRITQQFLNVKLFSQIQGQTFGIFGLLKDSLGENAKVATFRILHTSQIGTKSYFSNAQCLRPIRQKSRFAAEKKVHAARFCFRARKRTFFFFCSRVLILFLGVFFFNPQLLLTVLLNIT